MSQIGSLSVKLGLVTTKWKEDTAEARKHAKDLQKAFDDLGGGLKTLQGSLKTLGGGLGVATIGLTALIAKSLSFSNEIKDISEGFGISIAKTLQFRDALQTSGVSAEKAQKIMTSLFTKIQEAREGNETTIGQFQKLGISFNELVNLAPEKAIDKVFESLTKVGNTYQKVKAVKDLLGKAGIGVSIDEVAKKLSMSSAEYEKHAEKIKKVGELSDNLKTSMDNLTIAFTDLIAPFTDSNKIVSIDTFKTILIGMASMTVINGIIKLAEVIRILAMSWGALTLAIAASPVGIITTLVSALSALGIYLATKTSESSFEGFDISGAMGTGSSEIMGSADKTKELAENLPAVTTKASKEDNGPLPPRPELEAAKTKLKLSQDLLALQKEQAQYQLDAYQYTDLQNKQLDLMFGYRKQMLEFSVKEADIKKQYAEKPEIRDQLLKNLEIEKQAVIDLYQTRARLLSEEEIRRQSWSAGWEDAYRKFQQDSTNAFKTGAEAFNSIVGNMSSALDKFVKTGKLNFKDFAKSVIQDLISIQLRASAMKMFGGLFGSLFSSGPQLLNAETTYIGPAFASGGSITGNSPSLVGERGPELFIPNQSGTIVPNNQLGNALGGPSVVYNGPYIANMSAIDTQSATQFIASNKMSIFAANQSAARSLPASR
jgi:lambda family phage tail tape measure protein